MSGVEFEPIADAAERTVAALEEELSGRNEPYFIICLSHSGTDGRGKGEDYQLARQVGSVFQNPKSQFFNMDSDSELAFGLENQGMTRGEILRRLDDTTDRLHLKRLRGRNIFAMSGGEKQLLAFASVYAMRPEL